MPPTAPSQPVDDGPTVTDFTVHIDSDELQLQQLTARPAVPASPSTGRLSRSAGSQRRDAPVRAAGRTTAARATRTYAFRRS